MWDGVGVGVGVGVGGGRGSIKVKRAWGGGEGEGEGLKPWSQRQEGNYGVRGRGGYEKLLNMRNLV